jgi:DNA-3-methyladenine glycosylase
MYSLLHRSFYARTAKTVAVKLLGKALVRKTETGDLIGRIVETEAYYGVSDPASRAFGGKMTKLSKWLYAKPGTIFVYMVHGNWLFNIITGRIGAPSGVLIRALEPLENIETMLKYRKVKNIVDLTSGPGKLTKAFNITGSHTGLNVTDTTSPIIVVDWPTRARIDICSSHRIGVTKDVEEHLRFFINDNRFVSKK